MLNRIILFVLNALIIGVPYGFMCIIQNALTTIYPKSIQDPVIYLIIAGAFTINTSILKYGTFLGLACKKFPNVPEYFRHIQHFCIILSVFLFAATLFTSIAFLFDRYSHNIVPIIIILCTVTCIIVGLSAGYLKYLEEDERNTYI